MSPLHTPLSNLQLELLQLFAKEVTDEELNKIKVFIAKVLAEKAMDEADKVWDQENWTEEEVTRLSHGHLRTPYGK